MAQKMLQNYKYDRSVQNKGFNDVTYRPPQASQRASIDSFALAKRVCVKMIQPLSCGSDFILCLSYKPYPGPVNGKKLGDN